MRLLRVGPLGRERPAVLDANGDIRDVSDLIDDWDGPALADEVLKQLRRVDVSSLPKMDPASRIGPCVAGVGKFICIGLNYADHAEETGAEVPAEPVIFFKATSAICGPNDKLEIPRRSEKTDWEVELGVVIGKEAKYISEEDALEYVAGYCIIHDVSERAFQLEGTGQWVKGDKHFARHLIIALLPHPLLQGWRINRSRTNRIAADFLVNIVFCYGLGQTNDARLGHPICKAARNAGDARSDRTHVQDDTAASAHHIRQDCTR